MTVTHGKPYYAGVFTPVLFAAGGAAGVTTSTGWIAAMVVWGVLSAAAGDAVAARRHGGGIRHVNKEIAEMVGWPQFVDTVDAVYAQHPGATILTSNYSEAGVDRTARSRATACRNRSAAT